MSLAALTSDSYKFYYTVSKSLFQEGTIIKFSIAVVSKNRAYTKAYRWITPKLMGLMDELEQVEMTSPLGEAVLIIATDDDNLLPYEMKEIPNCDAYFQYAAGIAPYTGDEQLKSDIFTVITKVIERVPFAKPDHEQYASILKVWASRFMQ
ncbi:hypothetical protein D3C74_21730 [compost metagenome]